MTVRYIIRPEGFKQAALKLSAAMGGVPIIPASSVIWLDVPPQWGRDFFIAYPSGNVLEKDEVYDKIRHFYTRHKQGQRRIIREEGIKTPADYPSDRYVVRPTYHTQSMNYRVTDSPDDYNPDGEYISPLFPKTMEFRVIYSRGRPVIPIRKMVPEGTDPTIPWGNELSTTMTIRNPANNHLKNRTSFYDDMDRSFLSKADLIAVDVLMDANDNYAVCEMNFSPMLEVSDHPQRIVEHV